MSGKLNLPPNFEDRDFTFDDLVDLGSIDAGTYGRVRLSLCISPP